MQNLLLCLLLFPLLTLAQKREVFRIDSLPNEGVLLDQGWKWHAGDDPNFAKVDFDDSGWESIDPSQDLIDLPQIKSNKIGWLRLKIRFNIVLLTQPMMLSIRQAIATEIYADGKIIARFGKIDSVKIVPVYVSYKLLDIPIAHDSVVLVDPDKVRID